MNWLAASEKYDILITGAILSRSKKRATLPEILQHLRNGEQSPALGIIRERLDRSGLFEKIESTPDQGKLFYWTIAHDWEQQLKEEDLVTRLRFRVRYETLEGEYKYVQDLITQAILGHVGEQAAVSEIFEFLQSTYKIPRKERTAWMVIICYALFKFDVYAKLPLVQYKGKHKWTVEEKWKSGVFPNVEEHAIVPNSNWVIPMYPVELVNPPTNGNMEVPNVLEPFRQQYFYPITVEQVSGYPVQQENLEGMPEDTVGANTTELPSIELNSTQRDLPEDNFPSAKDAPTLDELVDADPNFSKFSQEIQTVKPSNTMELKLPKIFRKVFDSVPCFLSDNSLITAAILSHPEGKATAHQICNFLRNYSGLQEKIAKCLYTINRHLYRDNSYVKLPAKQKTRASVWTISVERLREFQTGDFPKNKMIEAVANTIRSDILITTAILSHFRERASVSEIYDFIQENLTFLCGEDNSWKNVLSSDRHKEHWINALHDSLTRKHIYVKTIQEKMDIEDKFTISAEWKQQFKQTAKKVLDSL